MYISVKIYHAAIFVINLGFLIWELNWFVVVNVDFLVLLLGTW